MEFIITGLFIIFFSYILLHSLYVRFFKSSGVSFGPGISKVLDYVILMTCNRMLICLQTF